MVQFNPLMSNESFFLYSLCFKKTGAFLGLRFLERGFVTGMVTPLAYLWFTRVNCLRRRPLRAMKPLASF